MIRSSALQRCEMAINLFSNKAIMLFLFFLFLFLFMTVPGCNVAWKAQNDFCFLVIANYSANENGMKEYCRKNGGKLQYATNKNTFRLLEQFLYTIQSENNPSQCIVTGPANTSSFSTLPLIQQYISDPKTHICAVRSSSQWKLKGCKANSCNHLCIAPRGE